MVLLGLRSEHLLENLQWLGLLVGGLMAFEYLTNSLAGTNEFFEWFDDNLSSFGAYGNPYQDGLFVEDLLLVIGKIALFLVIGFIGFRNRSLNLR